MDLPPRLDWTTAGIRAGLDVAVEQRVTRANWRLYPFSRWAFQHARELVPSRGLPREGRIVPLPGRPLALDAVRFLDGDGVETTFGRFLEQGYHDAVLVLHRGKIRFEHYANGMTPATPHMLFSITKSLVGVVAERLIARGAIDPLKPIGACVPELTVSGFGAVSLRHLLDMTDGVAFDETYADPLAQVHRYSATYWTPEQGHGGVLAALPGLVARDAEPGAAFRYRTPVADVVALALARETERSLRDLVAEEIWCPAGCGDEAYMLVDTAGTEIGGTGINATLRDMGRIAAWLLAPAQRATIDALLAGGDRGLFAAGPSAGTRPTGSYRSLWWIDHADPPSLAANGVYGQRLWLSPRDELAIVTFGSHPIAGNSFTDMAHRRAFAAIRAAVDRADES